MVSRSRLIGLLQVGLLGLVLSSEALANTVSITTNASVYALPYSSNSGSVSSGVLGTLGQDTTYLGLFDIRSQLSSLPGATFDSARLSLDFSAYTSSSATPSTTTNTTIDLARQNFVSSTPYYVCCDRLGNQILWGNLTYYTGSEYTTTTVSNNLPSEGVRNVNLGYSGTLVGQGAAQADTEVSVLSDSGYIDQGTRSLWTDNYMTNILLNTHIRTVVQNTAPTGSFGVSGELDSSGLDFKLLTETGVLPFFFTMHNQAYLDSATLTLTANIAPVPEPETYGMMLVGLGMMGFMVRRRKNEKA